MFNYPMARSSQTSSDQKLKWWQLSLLGVACTIGTGFFLGSHLAIEIAGPAVLLAYVVAGATAYIVFDKLARMTASDPLEGSFRSYAKKAYGRWAGFSSGWVYWSSELLIVGSQLTALSLFSRFWFPRVPMWCFATGFGLLGLLIVILGTRSFERWENVFAVVKVAAIVLFIVLALLALFGVFRSQGQGAALPKQWMPAGIQGLWSSLIFALYGYGGLEVMGLMALRLEKPESAPKAGTIMLLLLGAIYVTSLGLALVLQPWQSFRAEKSPFIVSLADYGLAFVPHVFIGVQIIAGFSTMTASIFAVTKILVTMASDRDAPPFFSRSFGKSKKPLAALSLTTVGLGASVLFALLMPKNLYEYVTTAAGLMLLYNWLFILFTSGRLLKQNGWGRVKQYLGIALVVLGVSGTWFHPISRPGLLISLGFIVVIGSVTLLMRRLWKRTEASAADPAASSSSSGQHPVRFKSKVQPEPDQG